MVDLLRHLNNRILINDLIVKKMQYEVNMLFYDYPSKEKAKLLATKINNQLDTALVGLKDEEKEKVRKDLIRHSFLVVPNPVSQNLNYGHVFTTLTNFDDRSQETKKRLTRWLDLNTEISVDEESLNQYITRYRVKQDIPEQKTAAIEYHPKKKIQQKKKYRWTKRIIWIPVSILVIAVMSFVLTLEQRKFPLETIDLPSVYEGTLDPSLLAFIDSYYEAITGDINRPYHYQPLDFKTIYAYLSAKKSKLVEADYLSIINKYAEPYNINPLLLIAIIGQEQNFVPQAHESVDAIINNPYNVFGSWLNYNTNFEDATRICLNTINTAFSTLPEDEDLIQWLNETYAEDKNWSIGVKSIFTKLQSLN